MGKAYFKKKRFEAKERKFQYELIRVTNTGFQSQEFNDAGRYPESLKPILIDDNLITVGFYANRKDVIKNLIFKSVHVSSNKDIVFSAEEYFVSQSEDISSGSTKKVNKYHYNDILCAKLNASGKMEWARNINKTEVTQGDAAYTSYTAYGHNNNTYFFINSGENPQELSKERIRFKQGYSRNPNLFVIKIADDGSLSHKKLIDDKEIRLPISNYFLKGLKPFGKYFLVSKSILKVSFSSI